MSLTPNEIHPHADGPALDAEAARLDETHPIERVGQGPIPRPSRVDEGKRRAAAEPLIEPDTAPPFVMVEADKPFLTGHATNNSVYRIWLDDGEFTADVSTAGSAWVPCASWDVLVERIMPHASDISRTREIHRLTGLVLAKLDGGAA